jgi:hypothetical protein
MYRLYKIELMQPKTETKVEHVITANRHIGIHPINPVLLDREQNVTDLKTAAALSICFHEVSEKESSYTALYVEDEDGDIFECWYPENGEVKHWMR